MQAVIEVEWPAHQKGNVIDAGDVLLEEFENTIMAFEPASESQKISHTEVIKSLNTVVENRGFRIQSLSTALPEVLWAVVLIGAVMNVGLTYLFWVENLRLHSLLVVAFSHRWPCSCFSRPPWTIPIVASSRVSGVQAGRSRT